MLIKQLIEKKKADLAEKRKTNPDAIFGIEKNPEESIFSASGTVNALHPRSSSNMNRGDGVSDNTSNIHMNEISRNTNPNGLVNDTSLITAQTSQWVKQKEFLKMSNTCQNKEKINHAIEKLIEACPG